MKFNFFSEVLDIDCDSDENSEASDASDDGNLSGNLFIYCFFYEHKYIIPIWTGVKGGIRPPALDDARWSISNKTLHDNQVWYELLKKFIWWRHQNEITLASGSKIDLKDGKITQIAKYNSPSTI